MCGKTAEILYKLMLRKGYPEAFAIVISTEMNTDYAADRMINYISGNALRPLEEVADEMLAIQSDRDRIKRSPNRSDLNSVSV